MAVSSESYIYRFPRDIGSQSPFERWPALSFFGRKKYVTTCCAMVNILFVALANETNDVLRTIMNDWRAMMSGPSFSRMPYIPKQESFYGNHGGNEVSTCGRSPSECVGNLSSMRGDSASSIDQTYLLETFAKRPKSNSCRTLGKFCSTPTSKSAMGIGPFNFEPMSEGGCSQDCAGESCGDAFPRIWGGIVTFNPNIDRFIENLGAISRQVDHVLVFDNGSDNAEEVENVVGKVANATSVMNRHNVGMAVALNCLASAAHVERVDHIVFLDQDSVADKGMVKELASRIGQKIGIVSPLIIDRNVARAKEDRELLYEIKRPITSGSMVNLRAWNAVGGYDERLFVDWVDNEFADNLRFHGYTLVRTHAAVLLHEMGRQEYAWSGPGRDYANNRRVSRGYYRQNYPEWRWEDRARSQAITMRKYGWSRIGIEERILFLKATMCRIMLIEPRKLVNLKAVVRGLRRARETGGRQ